jgi:glycosyltransferase involved in cell wall biosynthesis
VIDGGSTDGSIEVIRRYEPWLSGWVSEKDRGQSHAVNKGFRQCTGELLTFQNSDDFYLPGAFQDAAQLYTQNSDCGAIVGGFRRCDASSGLNGGVVAPALKLRSPGDLTLGPPGAYRLHQVSTFFTKSVLDKVGRYVDQELHFVMDRELLYRVCRRARIVLSPQCYGVFRIHHQSKTVASVLPFAREFAGLYLKHLNGNPHEDRLRRRMARYRISIGYLKAAKGNPRVMSAAWNLTRAAAAYAPLLRQRRYAGAWLRTLRLRKAT